MWFLLPLIGLVLLPGASLARAPEPELDPSLPGPDMPSQASPRFALDISSLVNQLFSFFSFNRSPVDATDKDTLARTIWGEARSEGVIGMQAVANVIMNRFEAAQQSVSAGQAWGFTVEQICKKPYQFSAWLPNDPNLSKMLAVTDNNADFRAALDIAERALRGTLPDITGGADHYLNVDVTRKIRGGSLPPWFQVSKVTGNIGSHTFLRLA